MGSTINWKLPAGRDLMTSGTISRRRMGILSACDMVNPSVMVVSCRATPPLSHQNVRSPPLRMMSSSSLWMTIGTIHSMLVLEQLRRKISHTKEISHPSPFRRVKSISYQQRELSSLASKGFGLTGPAICDTDIQGIDYHAAPSLCNERRYLWNCTGTRNKSISMWLKGSLPRFISKALHLHYGQRNEPSTLQKAFLCSLLNSRGDSTLKAVDSGRHSYLELSASCSLYPQESNWSTLDKMAYSGDSAASSPDPLLELEADIRTLRRRVRRQGEFMRQMDVQGGHRLDRMEDEISSSRAEFAEALEALGTQYGETMS